MDGCVKLLQKNGANSTEDPNCLITVSHKPITQKDQQSTLYWLLSWTTFSFEWKVEWFCKSNNIFCRQWTFVLFLVFEKIIEFRIVHEILFTLNQIKTNLLKYFQSISLKTGACALCNAKCRELKKRSAKGSHFKEDDSALVL